jgi:hypothetical protein
MSSTMHMHGGIGESIKRKEDNRFLRGKGNFLDDFVLPNMLQMAILRSPHAHARIKSIDTAAASAEPGVIAVVTGELMAQHKLAWMPTMSLLPSAPRSRSPLHFCLHAMPFHRWTFRYDRLTSLLQSLRHRAQARWRSRARCEAWRRPLVQFSPAWLSSLQSSPCRSSLEVA